MEPAHWNVQEERLSAVGAVVRNKQKLLCRPANFSSTGRATTCSGLRRRSRMKLIRSSA